MGEDNFLRAEASLLGRGENYHIRPELERVRTPEQLSHGGGWDLPGRGQRGAQGLDEQPILIHVAAHPVGVDAAVEAEGDVEVVERHDGDAGPEDGLPLVGEGLAPGGERLAAEVERQIMMIITIIHQL